MQNNSHYIQDMTLNNFYNVSASPYLVYTHLYLTAQMFTAHIQAPSFAVAPSKI